MSAAAIEPLKPADSTLIRQVHSANSAHPGPFLPNPSKMKRAARLAERGLLTDANVKLAPNPENWRAYYVTEAGINAYNATLAPAQAAA